MRLYEVVARTMAREGVRALFGLMGDGNLKLIPVATTEYGIPFYGSRHESGAVAMADGFARSTGEVGVCTFTQGPGLTNALTALVSARRGRTPLVVICGDTPTGVPGLPQDIRQRPFFAAAGIPVQEVSPDDAAATIALAFARARVERSPVALILPTDLQEHECAWLETPAAADAEPLRPPGEGDLAAAAAALSAAERPIVLAGRGAMVSGARESLIALADRCGALLAHSLPLKAYFAGHPFDLGIAGGFASERAQRLIGESDLVVAFGAGLNHFTSRGGTLFGTADLIHCDADPNSFGRYVPATITIQGDADVVAHELMGRIPRSDGYRTAAVAEQLASRDAHDDASDESGLDPRTLTERLDGLLPLARSLVLDGGHFMGYPAAGLQVPDPSAFVCTLDFGSIGLGLGAAIGVAIGRPDRVTVAAVGDGGLMMSLGELDTAVRYGVPLVVVVYNDGAYGAEMHFLRMLGLPDAASVLAVPPLDKVARSMGAAGISVRDVADLAELPSLIDGLTGPLVVDCSVTRNVRASWLTEAFERGTH